MSPNPIHLFARDLVGYGESPPDPPARGRFDCCELHLNLGAAKATLANGDDLSEGWPHDIVVIAKLGHGPLSSIGIRCEVRRGGLAPAGYFSRLQVTVTYWASRLLSLEHNQAGSGVGRRTRHE